MLMSMPPFMLDRVMMLAMQRPSTGTSGWDDGMDDTLLMVQADTGCFRGSTTALSWTKVGLVMVCVLC